MDDLIGYPLKEALSIIEEKENKIINIIKLIGTNNKFNSLNNPYVIRWMRRDESITLFVSYY